MAHETPQNVHIGNPQSEKAHSVSIGAQSASLSSSPEINSAITNSHVSHLSADEVLEEDEHNCIPPGMQKAAALIIGYIRREKLKFDCVNKNNKCSTNEIVCGYHTNIPLAIISIITCYYPNMNGLLFTWHIAHDNIIKNFINAKHKQRFASDIFEMKNLKWYLSAYPNGDRKEGACTVYLTLISFPSIWSKFICNYSIYCNQTRTSATYITQYTEKRSQSGRIAGLLSINEIKQRYNQKKLNDISFSVNVNILQIYDKSLSKKLIYQYELLHGSKFISKYVITWNVSKWMVNEFLESDAIKQYETDVYYDMFCLAFCPNGGWRENQGQARLSLKLCCLPAEISKIKVKMELLCVETETYYSDICDFAYDSKNTVRAWPTDMLLTPQLNGLNKLTFKCMISIIAKYDQNGNEIIEDHFQNDIIEWNNNQNVKHNAIQPLILEQHQDHNGDDENDNDMSTEYDGTICTISNNNNNNNDELQSQIKHITTVLHSLKLQVNDITSILDKANLMPLKYNANVSQQNGIQIQPHHIKEDIKENDKQEQVRYFLNEVVGLNVYYDMFIESGLEDMDIIKQLTMDELSSIGIKKLGHRKIIKQEIDRLNQIKISDIFWKIYKKQPD